MRTCEYALSGAIGIRIRFRLLLICMRWNIPEDYWIYCNTRVTIRLAPFLFFFNTRSDSTPLSWFRGQRLMSGIRGPVLSIGCTICCVLAEPCTEGDMQPGWWGLNDVETKETAYNNQKNDHVAIMEWVPRCGIKIYWGDIRNWESTDVVVGGGGTDTDGNAMI